MSSSANSRLGADSAPTPVWYGLVSRRFVYVLLLLHAAGLLWLLGSLDRARLIVVDFREVASEAHVNLPPERLRTYGFEEDSPDRLGRFRAIAERATSGARDDGERMRRLGDYILSLRRTDRPELHIDVPTQGLSALLDRMQAGEIANCGHMSAILAAFWRSLGGHARAVRWATRQGVVGHYAVELYSSSHRRWMYYDMNLNGYGADEQGVPLSLASLRSNFLTREGLHIVAHPTLRDWTHEQLSDFLREFSVEWYVMNNRLLDLEPDRRFGAWNWAYAALSRLPYPLDRVIDNLTTRRDRRLVVAGKVEIGGLFTFLGARLVAAYLLLMVFGCAATLLAPRLRVSRAARRAILKVRPTDA